MTEEQTPKPKKIGEGNKSLSVIVAEDKLVKFKAFSQGINLSMGWLLNQAIDRYLSSESTDIFKLALGDSDNTPKLKGVGALSTEVEELIRTSIDNYLLKTPIGNAEQNPPSLLMSDVEEIIKSSIGDLKIEELVKSSVGNLNTPSIGIHEVQKLVNESIEVALKPIKESVSELEAYARSQFAAVRDELKAISVGGASPTENRSVTTESFAEPVQGRIAVPITTKIAPNLTKPGGEPEWVNKDNRRFYLMLVGNSELIAKATEEIERHPNDNKSLAESLVKAGIHKQDGTAFDSASMSRIKGVVKNLNTPQPI